MKVDFYVLEAASGQKSLFFACKLIEKLHGEQKRVYIHTRGKDEAERFDALLWTYREDSFLPHNLYQEGVADPHPPLQIGYGPAPTTHRDTLINLDFALPAFFTQFTHVIEIVFSDPHVQQLARERFKQYREHGCEIHTIKLKAHEIS